jgi:hypothetical protein
MIHCHMSTNRDKETCMSCDTSVLEIPIKHLGECDASWFLFATCL